MNEWMNVHTSVTHKKRSKEKEMCAFKEKCQVQQGVEIKVELCRGVQCGDSIEIYMSAMTLCSQLCIAESRAKKEESE